jgi:cation-transporting ATPase E
MPLSLHFSKRQFQAIAGIVSRNVFLLINGIIFVVVIFLTIFGDVQEGIFLGLITFLNIVLGCFQEINAWLALEKLQLLAVPKVVRVNGDNTESLILAEEIKEKDKIRLKTGDQMPCDGTLVTSHGFGVNEGLITGEATDFLRKPGDKVFAGSIVTSGSGIVEVEKVFAESRIALMTKSIKKYSLVLSPIQRSISIIVKYTGYALLLVILFVIGRGFLVHESTLNIIQTIGALTSDLLPQGMVLIVTLLFSYGAVHLYHRNVLLQEVNAIEKMGRIKNLCMDKTGTLTDNDLSVERSYVAPGVNEKYAEESVMAYIKNSGDFSLTIEAIKKMLPGEYSGTTVDFLSFSSSRQFGAIHIKDELGERVVLAGAPDVFLPYFKTAEDKAWVQKYIDTEAKIGKRLICFAVSDLAALPSDLSGVRLSAISIFVLNNNLREGVGDAIRFFQDRGVTIRIISGDNPETVRAVAAAAGVNNADAVTTGTELETWTDADFLKKIHEYAVFARIKPEQKEKIIEALKLDGFTAMIGDGANDALAIKNADLGIAMFDGAQATRQIASVVLVKNSFSDLPGGVKLADSIIQNIKMCASLFFNQVFLGLFFFISLTVTGYSFPFTPLNFTFINYFAVGLPGALIFYWIVRPVRPDVARDTKSFLWQVLPFAFISAIPQSFVVTFAFYDSLEGVKNHGLTSLVLVLFIVIGFIFFLYAPSVYSGPTTKSQRRQFSLLAIAEIAIIVILLKIPFIDAFYNLKTPSLHSIIEFVPLIAVYALVQYGLVHWFFAMRPSGVKTITPIAAT